MTFLSSFHDDRLPSASMASLSISEASGIAMGKYGSKRANDGGIDSQGWRKFLKDRHPTKTAQAIAARTGISVDTIEKWFRSGGGASPSMDAAFTLASVYGPEFMATCVPGCGWMADAAREARRARLDSIISSATDERDRLLEMR